MALQDSRQGVVDDRREAIASLIYFALYVVYMFFHQEGEFGHWPTMILLPVLLLYLHRRWAGVQAPLRDTLGSIGLRRGHLRDGLWWAALLGLGLSVAQLYVGHRAAEVWPLIRSGRAALLFPLAFLLLVLTTGATEECLFRGILQSRLAVLLRSNVWAVLAAAVLFSLYHVPYAYLNPRWPSHGNAGAAILAAFANGMPAGLILGTIYVRTRNNLLACVIVHALIDTLPAMTMVKIQVQA